MERKLQVLQRRGGKVTRMRRQVGLKASRDEGVFGQIRKPGLSDSCASKIFFSGC